MLVYHEPFFDLGVISSLVARVPAGLPCRVTIDTDATTSVVEVRKRVAGRSVSFASAKTVTGAGEITLTDDDADGLDMIEVVVTTAQSGKMARVTVTGEPDRVSVPVGAVPSAGGSVEL